MNVLVLILLVLFVVLEGLAGFGVGAPRFHLVALGLCAYGLAELLGNLHV